MGNIFSKLFGGKLIPTARVDKNGRVVIRHMKPEVGDTGEANMPPPPPPVRKDDTAASSLESAVDLLVRRTNTHESLRDAEIKSLRWKLSHFSGVTLRKISGLEDNAASVTASHHVHLEMNAYANEDYVRDVIEVSGFYNDRALHDDNCLFTLQRYPELCPIAEDESYPEERYRQATRLMEATSAILRSGAEERDKSVFSYATISMNRMPVPRIADDKLVELILESSDSDYEQIIALIRERSMVDSDDITELLKRSGPSALSGGEL